MQSEIAFYFLVGLLIRIPLASVLSGVLACASAKAVSARTLMFLFYMGLLFSGYLWYYGHDQVAGMGYAYLHEIDHGRR